MLKQQVAENAKISPFLVFYLIVGMQIGIGILGFQRPIAKAAGYDSWISVVAAGLTIHVIIWMIYKITETAGGDLVHVHEFIFGKKIAKLLSSLFILYELMLSITVLRAFIEIVQVWVFRDITPFWYGLAYLILCIYIVYGGFRTVAGIAFFSCILPSYLLLTFVYPIQFSDITNIQPIFDHSFKDMMKAFYQMSLTYTGYEALLFFYPFIKDPQKSKKWAHMAVFTTTFIYTILALITFSYFAEKQLQETIWGTLNMWKIVEMPFVERFEYIGIANWNLIILPNVCIPLWVASRIGKRIFHIRQKIGVIVIAAFCLITLSFIKTRTQVLFLSDLTGKISFVFSYIYIPFLFIAAMIAKKVKQRD
jgi:spore germination protein AB